MLEDSITRRTILGGAAALAVTGSGSGALAQSAGKSVLGRSDGQWLNAPKTWSVDRTGDLTLVTDKDSDFWRETHYGFTRDSGHFLGFPTGDAFTAQLRIRGQYEKLYD